MIINNFIQLIWLHFVADFFLQTPNMSLKKSKNIWFLLYHIIIYSIPFLIFLPFKFVLVNSLSHFLVDFITSKSTHYLYEKKKYHWFFVVIGFDQALHLSILYLLWRIL